MPMIKAKFQNDGLPYINPEQGFYCFLCESLVRIDGINDKHFIFIFKEGMWELPIPHVDEFKVRLCVECGSKLSHILKERHDAIKQEKNT